MQQRPVRLSAPQIQVLQYLREGWRCESVALPLRFSPLCGYPFRQKERCIYISGTTLASLQRRGWIAWEATTLTWTYDGSTHPGYRLVLTAEAPDARPCVSTSSVTVSTKGDAYAAR